MSLLSKCTAYWKLNANSNDSVGSNNGTDTSVSYGAGKISDAATYNGSTSNTFINDSATFDFNSDFTLAMWIKRGTLSINQVVAGQANSGAGDISFYIYYPADDSIIFAVENTSFVDYTANYSTPPTDSNWHHFIFERDANVIKMYIDNAAVGTTSTFSGTCASTSKLAFGWFGEYSGLPFYGSLDEIYFANSVLTPTEKTELYNSGAGLTYPFTSNTTNFFRFF